MQVKRFCTGLPVILFGLILYRQTAYPTTHVMTYSDLPVCTALMLNSHGPWETRQLKFITGSPDIEVLQVIHTHILRIQRHQFPIENCIERIASHNMV